MKPFLKWAGGKYKIINRILEVLPKGHQLIEPIAASGAVFLNTNYKEYLIADSNADLITLYKQIQEGGNSFIDFASELFTPKNNTEDAFYALREEFNHISDPSKKSAIFIYLNRHCFNGLCRYNSKGIFNVPFGRYSSPSFPKAEILNFYQKSEHAVFEVSDFRNTMAKASKESVVYCDPPYAPLTTTANFSAYTQDGFNAGDQEALAKCAKELSSNGIPVIISNHDTIYTRNIYSDAAIVSFDVQRFISSKANARGKAAELIALYT